MDTQIPFAKDATDVARRFEQLRQQAFPHNHSADALKGHGVFSGRIVVSIVRCFIADHVIYAVKLGIASG